MDDREVVAPELGDGSVRSTWGPKGPSLIVAVPPLNACQRACPARVSLWITPCQRVAPTHSRRDLRECVHGHLGGDTGPGLRRRLRVLHVLAAVRRAPAGHGGVGLGPVPVRGPGPGA